MATATHCNPSLDLRQILNLTPGLPTDRLQAALRPLGLTLTELAAQLGVSRNHASQVINGLRESARLRRRIAEFLSARSSNPVAVSDIWPESASEQAAA